MPVLNIKTKFIIRFLMVIFSVFVALVGLEILIRWDEKMLPERKYQEPGFIKEIYDEMSVRKRIQEKGISEKTFNIYYFGESTMYGEPYRDTIPILVEKMLEGRVGGAELKWINMGIPGIDFNEVVRRIRQVVEQKNIYYPSLIVIYSGHNEFLYYQDFEDGNGFSFRKDDTNPIGFLVSRSRLAHKVAKVFKIYRLEVDERKFFDVPVVKADKRVEILKNYEDKVQSTISYLKNNQVPVVISTQTGNYADFEPNRSVYTGDELKKEEFKKYMDEGLVQEKNGENQKALSSYEKALKIDKGFAETYYRLGRAYRELGENEKAWEAYSKAVDFDMMPIRATSSQNEFIKGIGEDKKTKIIDTVNYLREKSETALIGNNKFTPISEEEVEKLFNTKEALFSMYTSRADWMVRLSTWRYDFSNRLMVAENYLEKAREIYERTAYYYLTKMTIAYLRKDMPEAEKNYEMARKINRKETNEYLRNHWINQVIKRALN